LATACCTGGEQREPLVRRSGLAQYLSGEDQSMTANITAGEREARLQLAACYRVFDHLGWTELIYNHITLRVPDEEGAFLINPYGFHFSEVTASSLVKIDIEGNRLDDSKAPINQAGFVQHAAFHAALPSAHCVMHTHTTAGMAVSCLENGLSITNFYAAFLAGKVSFHAFEGVTTRSDEGPRLIASMGQNKAMILHNHGLLTIGRTLPAAFQRLWLLQRACEVQIAAATAGPLYPIDPAILESHGRDAAKLNQGLGMGEIEFAALVRLVDRKDRSWRD
jgi:ribulose-5-phosphate 4-epimerase/fuculose-1-phosphate aldolase